jgi:hypothetical protein
MATEIYHIVEETPANSASYEPTGETVTTDAETAVLRCIELARIGTRFGFWVESAP